MASVFADSLFGRKCGLEVLRLSIILLVLETTSFVVADEAPVINATAEYGIFSREWVPSKCRCMNEIDIECYFQNGTFAWPAAVDNLFEICYNNKQTFPWNQINSGRLAKDEIMIIAYHGEVPTAASSNSTSILPIGEEQREGLRNITCTCIDRFTAFCQSKDYSFRFRCRNDYEICGSSPEDFTTICKPKFRPDPYYLETLAKHTECRCRPKSLDEAASNISGGLMDCINLNDRKTKFTHSCPRNEICYADPNVTFSITSSSRGCSPPEPETLNDLDAIYACRSDTSQCNITYAATDRVCCC